MIQTKLAVSVYLGAGSAIVAPKYGNGGLYWEQENPDLLPANFDSATLGSAVNLALEKFAIRTPPNFRNYKISDWPALRASKCKSGKQFRSQYSLIQVICENKASEWADAELQALGKAGAYFPTGKTVSLPVGKPELNQQVGQLLLDLALHI